MSILSFLKSGATESFVGGVMDIIKNRFPGKLSEGEEQEFKLSIINTTNEQILKLQQLAQEEQMSFDDRIKKMEGTAADLKSIPGIGPLLILLRGVQRPFWGFGTFYLDHMWFFGSGAWTERQETTLLVINVLVLGFLFGERALKNLEPLLSKLFAKSNAG